MSRRREGIGGWFQNQLYNTSLVWLLALTASGGVYYIRTTDTFNVKLEAHDKRFDSIESALKDQQNALKEAKKTELTEREKVRSDFLADSKATSAGIAELNKQTAVMGTVLVSVKDELSKINQRLDAPPNKLR